MTTITVMITIKTTAKIITVTVFIGSNYRPLVRSQALFQGPYIDVASFPDKAGAIIISTAQKRKRNAPGGRVTCPAGKCWTGIQAQAVQLESMA